MIQLCNNITAGIFIIINIKYMKLDEIIILGEELKQVNGKWALVSKSTGRPLRYYK